MEADVKGKYFIALDLGTTSTRAHVIDKSFTIVSGARFESDLIENNEGIAELDPEVYFNNIVRILRDAVNSASVDPKEIISLGISSQRSTFITWDKDSGESFHNLITWKDKRAIKNVQKTNKSLLLKFVNNGSLILFTLTRNDFFKVTSKLKVGNTWVNHRLQYTIETNERLKRAIKDNRARYGCLDTWLLCRLKMNHNSDHISDITSSAGTGIFDVFRLDFSTPMLKYFNVKRSILPTVVSNFHDFGCTHEEIFGVPIKIDVVITDQSASMIANCCFKQGSSKITLGTGSFLQINMGGKCRGSNYGALPLVAWSIKNSHQKTSTVFKLEFFHQSSSDAIKFISTVGLCSDVTQLSGIASSIEDSDGVYFIPSVYGFVGVKQTTKDCHLIRAVLENIIFTIGHYYFSMRKDRESYRPKKIRIDGGIAQNDFVCQQIASLTSVDIERSEFCSEQTSVGCAILSAYKNGILQELEDAERFYKPDKVFLPDGAVRVKLLTDYGKFVKIMKEYKCF